MADFPELSYGTVHGRFLAIILDSADAAAAPDAEALSGHVTFSATAPILLVTGAAPDPATVFPQSVRVNLDPGGYLHVNGSHDVSLLATNDADGNPVDWQWHVEFALDLHGKKVAREGFNFYLPADTTVDLTVVAPLIELSDGTIIIQGPPGESASDLITAQGDLITGDAAGDAAILPVGAAGSYLAPEPAAPYGLEWKPLPIPEPGVKVYPDLAALDLIREPEIGTLHVNNLALAFPSLAGTYTDLFTPYPADLLITTSTMTMPGGASTEHFVQEFVVADTGAPWHVKFTRTISFRTIDGGFWNDSTWFAIPAMPKLYGDEVPIGSPVPPYNTTTITAQSEVGPNTLVKRDTLGRAQIGDPTDPEDIANKGYVDTAIGEIPAAPPEPPASETVAGIARYSTQAEVDAGTDLASTVRPGTLAPYVAAAIGAIPPAEGLKRYANTAELDAVRVGEVGVWTIPDLAAEFPYLVGAYGDIFAGHGPAELVVTSSISDYPLDSGLFLTRSLVQQVFTIANYNLPYFVRASRIIHVDRETGAAVYAPQQWAIEPVMPVAYGANHMPITVNDGASYSWSTIVPTSGADADSLVRRSATGTTQMQDPVLPLDIANLQTVQAQIAAAPVPPHTHPELGGTRRFLFDATPGGDPGAGHISIENAGGQNRVLRISKTDADGNAVSLAALAVNDSVALSHEVSPATIYARGYAASLATDAVTHWEFTAVRESGTGALPAEGTALILSIAMANGAGSSEPAFELPDRLGVNAVTITDWNLARENGWYKANGALNQPPMQAYGGNWWMGTVEVAFDVAPFYIVQEVFTFVHPEPSPITMRRIEYDGVWQPWVRIYKTLEEISPLAGVPARLGPYAEEITDWNAVDKSGWFMATDALNAPAPGWFIGESQCHNDLYTIQYAYVFTEFSTRGYRRQKISGGWGAWAEAAAVPPRLDLYAQSVTDWNDVRTNGFYNGNNGGTINQPGVGNWLGIVTAHNDRYVVQEVYCYANGPANAKQTWRREMVDGTWHPWERVYKTAAELAAPHGEAYFDGDLGAVTQVFEADLWVNPAFAAPYVLRGDMAYNASSNGFDIPVDGVYMISLQARFKDGDKGTAPTYRVMRDDEGGEIPLTYSMDAGAKGSVNFTHILYHTVGEGSLRVWLKPDGGTLNVYSARLTVTKIG